MPALAAPPTRPLARPNRTAPLITPQPGETQARFVDRCMRSLKGTTDERNSQAYAAWERSGRESDLQAIARRAFPPDKFRRVPNRCLFAEHTKRRTIHDPRTGEPREIEERYDRAALEAICYRLNERIRDTSDFAPLTAGHTPSDDARENGVEMPDVLGYAGPFRLGVIGNVEPRYAIFGDEYHHIEDVPRLQKLQRRSPEVWLEENMGDRFFDPIACLGAETPRLDMGLTRFARTADGRSVAKYAAVAVEPGAGSTFLPSFDTGERQKLDKHAAGDKPMALAPEDIKQIVDAFEQLPWVQWVKDQMNNGVNDGIGAPGADAGAPPMPGADAGMPPPDAGAGAPPPDANPDQNAARSMYECGDDDRDAMAKYASGEMDDAGLMSHMQGKRQAYQASAGTAEGAAADNPTNNGTVAAAGVASYSRGGDLVNENSRLKKELYALKARVDRADGERREHYRRAKLQARQSEGFAFDIDDEMQLCGDMSDKQFERHVQHTIAKYERAPIGMAAIYAPPLDRTTADKQKYARDLSERTQKIILREREKGKSLTWDEAGEMAAKELAGSAA